MKRLAIATAILALMAGAAPGQQSFAPQPLAGMGSKSMQSCSADIRKYCATASDYMRKECLVRNWDTITSDCQDALGKPFDGVSPRRGD